MLVRGPLQVVTTVVAHARIEVPGPEIRERLVECRPDGGQLALQAGEDPIGARAFLDAARQVVTVVLGEPGRKEERAVLVAAVEGGETLVRRAGQTGEVA